MFGKALILSLLPILFAVYFNYDSKYVTIVSNYVYSKIRSIRGNKIETLFTVEELQSYNGIDRKELYLSILGNVFDVTRADKYYGPGQTYNFFVGRDASRSFVTGEFVDKSGLDDVTGFDHQELRSLKHWLDFYKKEYTKKGKLIGTFYDGNGKSTALGRHIKRLIRDAQSAEVSGEMEKLKFPPCNVEWDAERGTRVWCTTKSGGVDRKWVGVPRQLYEPGSESYRCACVSDENKNLGNIKEYEGCNPLAESCLVKME